MCRRGAAVRRPRERSVTCELQLGRHRVQVQPCGCFSCGQIYVSRSFCCSVCPPTLQSREGQGGRDEGCLELVILSSLWLLVSPACGRIAAFPGPCLSSYFGLMCRRERTLVGSQEGPVSCCFHAVWVEGRKASAPRVSRSIPRKQRPHHFRSLTSPLGSLQFPPFLWAQEPRGAVWTRDTGILPHCY